MASGKYKGQRLDQLDQETYHNLRKTYPDDLAIAHVLNENEVRTCLKRPYCAVASDGLLSNGQGHPRAAGTFPRALRWLREEGFSWPEALHHLTTLPAEMIWSCRGGLREGAPGDVVVFNPSTLCDQATFKEPLAPPQGISYVFVGGNMAVEQGKVLPHPQGHFLLRSGEV